MDESWNYGIASLQYDISLIVYWYKFTLIFMDFLHDYWVWIWYVIITLLLVSFLLPFAVRPLLENVDS